jgi:predicted ArsR family transcriptional regulator
MKKRDWTVQADHGTVLVYLAEHSQAIAQEIAQETGISTQAVQNIIVDLEKTGCIKRHKEGNCNHYTVHSEQPIRHSLQGDYPAGNMLQSIGFPR